MEMILGEVMSGSSSSKGSNYSDTHEILGPYYDEILEKT